jgi:hypothetical protein
MLGFGLDRFGETKDLEDLGTCDPSCLNKSSLLELLLGSHREIFLDKSSHDHIDQDTWMR